MTIRTYEDAHGVVIEVSDDGVGFDPSAIDDGHTHTGDRQCPHEGSGHVRRQRGDYEATRSRDNGTDAYSKGEGTMKIIAVDDEPLALRGLVQEIKKVLPECDIAGFTDSSDALKILRDNGFMPDVAFLDIEMPGIKRHILGKKIQRHLPENKYHFCDELLSIRVGCPQLTRQRLFDEACSGGRH